MNTTEYYKKLYKCKELSSTTNYMNTLCIRYTQLCTDVSWDTEIYDGVSKSFRTESITKYTPTTINTRSEATQRVMVQKLTRLTHKIAI